MAELYPPEGFFVTTLSSDINASTATIPLTAVPSTVTKGYLVIEPSSSTAREVVHFTSVGVSTVTAADDTTDASDATGRGCKGSITVGANTSHSQGATVIIAATYNYWKRLMDKLNGSDATVLVDSSGNEILKTASVASAVNELTLKNAATGNGPEVQATGGDTDIDLKLVPKGTGAVVIPGTSTSSGAVKLYEDTDNGTNYMAIKAPAAVTADKTLTLPDGVGSSGQVLSTDGTGALSWATPGSSISNMYQNALINGGMDIWQRATTFTTPNDDTFGPDRWNFLLDGNGTWTFTRDTDVPTGDFKYSLKCTNVTLNKQCGIVQLIENIDAEKLQDKVVSLSFYAKTSGTEIGNLRATVLSWTSTADAMTSDVVGTWAGNGTDPTWATNYTAEVAGSNKALTSSWQRFTIENFTLDTASINNLAIVIWVDDTTIAANDDFWITGVQLNTGTTASSFMPRYYTNELLLCQRYCWALAEASNGIIGNGRTESTTRALIFLPHPVEMFREPTLTATAGDWQVVHTTSATDCSAVQLFSGGGTLKGTLFGFDVAAGLTAGQACQVRADAGGTRVLILDAEM